MITPVIQLPGEPETPQLQPPAPGEPDTPQLNTRTGIKAQTSSILDHARHSMTASSSAPAAGRLAKARQAPPPRILQDTQIIGASSSQSSSRASQTQVIAPPAPAHVGRPKAPTNVARPKATCKSAPKT